MDINNEMGIAFNKVLIDSRYKNVVLDITLSFLAVSLLIENITREMLFLMI